MNQRSGSLARSVAAVVVLATAAKASQAQQSPVGKGGWIVAGTASLLKQTSDAASQSSTSISLSPTALRFVVPRFAVGASADFGYTSFESDNHRSDYGIGPMARYYFGDTTAKLLPFLSAALRPVWQHATVTTVISGVSRTTTTESRLMTYDASAGITQLLTSSVGLTGEAFYSRFVTSLGGGVPSPDLSQFGVRFGFTAFVR